MILPKLDAFVLLTNEGSGMDKRDLASSHLVSSLASILATSAQTSIKFRSINRSMYSSSQYQKLHPSHTIKIWVSVKCAESGSTTEAKLAHTPSFLHLTNTHLGCSGIVDTRRTTFHGQSSHFMSGNDAPMCLWANTEPGDNRWCICRWICDGVDPSG